MSNKPKTVRSEPTLANVITMDIEAAFRCKSYLYAAWDLCLANAVDEEGEKEQEKINEGFTEAASHVNDFMDQAINAAAQKAADAILAGKMNASRAA